MNETRTNRSGGAGRLSIKKKRAVAVVGCWRGRWQVRYLAVVLSEGGILVRGRGTRANATIRRGSAGWAFNGQGQCDQANLATLTETLEIDATTRREGAAGIGQAVAAGRNHGVVCLPDYWKPKKLISDAGDGVALIHSHGRLVCLS